MNFRFRSQGKRGKVHEATDEGKASYVFGICTIGSRFTEIEKTTDCITCKNCLRAMRRKK